MPELPEVETIRRALNKTLPGQKIRKILVRDSRLRWPVDETRLKQLVLGQTVSAVERRAKYLLVTLKQESTLVIHLGMSGRLLFFTEAKPFAKHDHVIFYLDNGSELRFQDTRRFGMVDAIPPGEVENYVRFVNLGVEPLDKITTGQLLYDRSRNSKKPIKNLLMDSNFIVGVGNIYANEALFYAGIHPRRASSDLTQENWRRLHESVRQVLNKAIKKGGTTLTDFVDSNGEFGYFQLSLAVYDQAGKPCKRCKSEIVRYVQVGRSTFYCPKCQK